MNMFKKNGGFTLVELIVVIAILAILAGIAVPAYSGYLKSAEKAGDITTLSAVKTAAFAAMATEDEVEKIVVTVDEDGKVTDIAVNPEIVTTEDADGNETEEDKTVYLYKAGAWNNDNFQTYMNDSVPTLKFFIDGAEWSNVTGEWDVYVAPTEATTEGE